MPVIEGWGIHSIHLSQPRLHCIRLIAVRFTDGFVLPEK